MNAVATAPSVSLRISAPELRKSCSLNMINRTAAAKPLPWASVNSGPWDPAGLARAGRALRLETPAGLAA